MRIISKVFKSFLLGLLLVEFSGCLYFLRETVPCDLNESASVVFSKDYPSTYLIPSFMGWRDEQAGELLYVARELDEFFKSTTIDIYSVNVNSPSLNHLLGSVSGEAGSTSSFVKGGASDPEGNFYISVVESDGAAYTSSLIKVTANGAVSKLVAGYQFQGREVQFTNPAYYKGKIYVADREESYDVNPYAEKRLVLLEIDPDSGAVAIADDTFCFACSTSKKVMPTRVIVDPSGSGVLISGSAEDALDAMNLFVVRFVPGTGLINLSGEVEAGPSENWGTAFMADAGGGGIAMGYIASNVYFFDFGSDFSTFTSTLVTSPSGVWMNSNTFRPSVLADEYLVNVSWKDGTTVEGRLGTSAVVSSGSIVPTKTLMSSTYESGVNFSGPGGEVEGNAGVVLESVYSGRFWSRQSGGPWNYGVSISGSIDFYLQDCQ